MATKTAQADQFIEDLVQSSSLQTQFAIAAPTSLDGVLEFASNKGYVITVDELEAALKHVPSSAIVDQIRQFVR